MKAPPEQGADQKVDRERNRDGADGSVLSDQPASDEAKADTDAKQSKQIKQLQLWAWFFGPGIAIIAVVFTGLQWRSGEGQREAAEGQLQVMRDQLKDARDGATHARKDADVALAAAKSQAESMKTLADATKTMADSAKLSAESSAKIAEGNKRQLAIAESQAASLSSQAESVRSEADSMRGLTEANKVIADATSRNAETSASLAATAAATAAAQERATELEHSAWVWFSGIEIVQDDKPTTTPLVGKQTYLRFTLVNTGRTPAADVHFEAVFADQGKVQYAAIDRGGYRPVAAGETITVTLDIGQLQTDLASLGIIFNPFRVRAVLAYKDVFGEARKNLGCYRSELSESRATRHQKFAVAFTSCEGHNWNYAQRRDSLRRPNDTETKPPK